MTQQQDKWDHMRSRCSPRLRSIDLPTSGTGILWARDNGFEQLEA